MIQCKICLGMRVVTQLEFLEIIPILTRLNEYADRKQVAKETIIICPECEGRGYFDDNSRIT